MRLLLVLIYGKQLLFRLLDNLVAEPPEIKFEMIYLFFKYDETFFDSYLTIENGDTLVV